MVVCSRAFQAAPLPAPLIPTAPLAYLGHPAVELGGGHALVPSLVHRHRHRQQPLCAAPSQGRQGEDRHPAAAADRRSSQVEGSAAGTRQQACVPCPLEPVSHTAHDSPWARFLPDVWQMRLHYFADQPHGLLSLRRCQRIQLVGHDQQQAPFSHHIWRCVTDESREA